MNIIEISSKSKVGKLRDEIAQIGDQLKALDTLPPPRDEIEQRISDWLEVQAGGSVAYAAISGFVSPNNGSLVSSIFQGWDLDSGGDWRFNPLVEFLKLQALVAPETLKAGLMALVDRHLADRECGPPTAERPAVRAELNKKRRQLEIEEEREIEKRGSRRHVVHSAARC